MNLRKKRCVLMNSGVWKGHIRNISGNPVTLENALGLQKLEVLGNSVQNGTPSPDNPVEVVGVGERTLNLFNATLHPKITIGGYIDPNGNCVGKPLYVPVVAGKTYTISKRNKSISGYDFYSRAIRFEDDNGNLIRADTLSLTNGTIFVGGTGTDSSRYFSSATFTVPENATILRVGGLPNTADALQKLCDEIMLVEGEYTADTLPSYEPYGYKIPVSVEGSNLFNSATHPKITTGGYLSNDGSLVGNPLKIPVVSGKTYTISKRNPSPYGYDFYYRAIAFENSYGDLVRSDTRFATNGTVFSGAEVQYFSSATFTVPENATILRVGCLPNTADALQKLCDDLVLNYGTTALPYEQYKEAQTLNIYTPQILHGLGDVSDTVVLDFDNRKAELVQNIEQDVFDGGWAGYLQTGNICRSYHATPPQRRVSPVGIIDVASDIFIATTASLLNNAVYQIAGNTNTSVINVTLDANALVSADIDGFNTFMTEHPATIYYVLKSPVTTDISNLQDWDNMPQLTGTITLTASGTAEPKLNVTYYSTIKE